MKAIVYKDDLGEEFETTDIPAELVEQAQEYHHQLIDTIAEFDDEVLEAYLTDEDSVTPEMIKRALRAATLADEITPVILGSAFKNKGVQPLLDAVIDYLPSPLDVPPMQGIDPKSGDEITREPSPDEPFSALAFKVMSDPFVGKLTYFRVYSGTIKAGDRVLNTTTGKTERDRPHPPDAREPPRGARRDRRGRHRRGRRPQVDDDRRHARDRERADRARVDDVPGSGDLGRRRAEVEGRPGQARHGPRPARRGGSDLPRHLGRGDRPDDHRRHGRAPPRDHRRPPEARVQRRRERRPPAGRLPRDDRRSRPSSIQGKFVRQTGGSGQYGDAVINLLPQEPGAGYEFVDKIVGGKIPKEYIKPIDEGIREAMGSGVLAGYPVVDVKVELIDGSYHDVDSSERAFKIAGSMAFKEAMKRAKPKLLEPMMAVEVTTPEDYLGDVMGNLNSRRGRIENMAPRRQRAGDQGERPAERDVRLRHRPAVDDPRAAPISPCSSTGTRKCRRHSRPRSPSRVARGPN